MKQFTEEMGKDGMMGNADFGGTGGGGGTEKALDDIFKKMMLGEGHGPADGAAADDDDGDGPPSMPSVSPPSKSKSNGGGGNATPRKSNKHKKSSSSSKSSEEPNVDESINRLLDGINRATNAPLPDPNLTTPTSPTMPDNMDPNAQFENLSEEMMNSIMGEFTKMSNAKDSDTVVDGVMKQLLDKELMYGPMKEVCQRFPSWLASNKDELSHKEYERYGQQYQYFQRIVRVYETEPENFDRLMELMQDIQEYGQPPVDIIKELAPELEFDDEGMPVMDPTGGGGGGGGFGGMTMPPGMMMPGMPFPGGGGGNEQCCIS